jgi:hypothetical protein
VFTDTRDVARDVAVVVYAVQAPHEDNIHIRQTAAGTTYAVFTTAMAAHFRENQGKLYLWSQEGR